MKRKTPKKLATPNDHKKGREKISEVLNLLIADAFAIYIKAKNFHWHVSGSHFRDYHLLFDEQADQILAMIDPLAERIRKLGGITIHSTGEITRLQRIKDENGSFLEPQKMLTNLLNDNKAYVTHLQAAHKVCEKQDDVATCSVLEIFIDETERRIWFLFEALSGK